MTDISELFLLIGAIMLGSLVINFLGAHFHLPRVTLLLLFGLLIGPSGLDLLDGESERWFPLVADVALLMIGFLLGEKLSRNNLKSHGNLILSISLTEASFTALTVLAGLLLIGIDPAIALLLAGIATATAPAATVAVTRDLKTKGLFSWTLLGVVALDDAWGLIIFSLMMAIAESYTGNGATLSLILHSGTDIIGALLIGIALGIPAALLTGRISSGEPTLVEAIGIIFLCGGIALFFDVSLLLAVMAMGATIANLARHHIRPFHAIEHIEWPFMILFFVMAGAALRPAMLLDIGLLGVAYILLRATGKIAGAWLGAGIGRAPRLLRRWMGIALMPQAGVAMGMALIVRQRFPEIGETVLTVVIGAVVIFELLGPMLTRYALIRAGDAAGHNT